jgi:hypothetical protein
MITFFHNYPTVNRTYKNGLTIFKNFLFLIPFFLSSCTHISIKNELIQSLKNQFSISSFPQVQNIAGNSFTEKNVNKVTFSIDSTGDFLFSPGDYSIPVMTYCMKSSSSSPAGHTYTISRIKGRLAPIIRELNLKAPKFFSSSDIQIVLWSLEAGLSYEEMTERSKKIIDLIIPQYRDKLKESVFSTFEQKWNNISDKSDGKLPSLSESMDNIDGQLGETGFRLKEMRDLRNKLREVGHNYEELRRLIDTSPSNKNGSKTPWSKISENIYLRFVTEGSFGNIGFLQIRVIPKPGRNINSDIPEKFSLDITSLIANPNDQMIQPLSFSPLMGIAGVMTTPQIAVNPRAAVLLLALTLIVYPMNWDDFFKLDDLLEGVNDKNVRSEIARGNEILRKEHDELEKPLKEAGVISGKDKKYSKEKNEVREYRKSGGIEKLQKDFEKIQGDSSKLDDGLDIKILPNGTKIVKRPEDRTIEVQPPKKSSNYPDQKIRIKVRYP